MSATDRRLRIAVLGSSGYVGGELLRLLIAHPEVGEVRAASRSHSGRLWSEAHPALSHAPPRHFEDADTQEIAAWADVVLLAWPHGRAQELIEPVLAGRPRLVVDLSADFRIPDPSLYAAHYGPHSRSDLLGSFRYGLADVAGDTLLGATRIATPGCFATAALLAAHALGRQPPLESPPVCFAVTGSSGSGASPRRTTHHPVRAHNLFAYALEGHRHEAELSAHWLGRDAAPRLITHSGPFVRGIHATLHARVTKGVDDLLDRARTRFDGRPFVRVLDQPPELAAVVGTNYAHIHCASRSGGRELVVTVAIDNLVKGAAGQALQAMNLALGFDETAGLTFPGLYPC